MYVFPELEERLRAVRAHLEWVDLRIGIATASLPSESVGEQQVLKVCLAETRRCRPFLIVLRAMATAGFLPANVQRVRRAMKDSTRTSLTAASLTSRSASVCCPGINAAPERLPQ